MRTECALKRRVFEECGGPQRTSGERGSTKGLCEAHLFVLIRHVGVRAQDGPPAGPPAAAAAEAGLEQLLPLCRCQRHATFIRLHTQELPSSRGLAGSALQKPELHAMFSP